MKSLEIAPISKNYVNGKFTNDLQRTLNILSPLDGTIISKVPLSSKDDLDHAVLAAKTAFHEWSSRTMKKRVQTFYIFRQLLEDHIEELTELVCIENGKTHGEAKAEVLKGIELCEFACSLPQLINDEIQEVSKGVECRTSHVPIGVVASITPFNFPHMVPLWTIPNALALGNCMILKPSEQTPLSAGKIAQLLQKAGLPDGVFNIVNGDKEIVEAICDHPGIEAVSFVGSTPIGKLMAMAFIVKSLLFKSSSKFLLNFILSGCRLSE